VFYEKRREIGWVIESKYPGVSPRVLFAWAACVDPGWTEEPSRAGMTSKMRQASGHAALRGGSVYRNVCLSW
jgi:hypothetical protein